MAPADRYTHGHHESVLRSHRWRTVENSAAYLIDDLVPGRTVLDVGCGPGTITLDFGRRVAPGAVVGLDREPSVVDEARQAAVAAGVEGVEFRSGDVYALPFDNDTFDVVHAHQVLQHLTDPVAALRELGRVVRPGGVVAVRDSDYSAMSWYPLVPELEAWLDLYLRLARRNGAEPDAGRRLLTWAHAAGFDDAVPSSSVWCFATTADRSWWAGMWADRVTGSAFAEQAINAGLADAERLGEIAAGWRRWAVDPDAWFAVVHGEVRGRGRAG